MVNKTDELLREFAIRWGSLPRKDYGTTSEKCLSDLRTLIDKLMPTKEEVIAKGENEIAEWLKGNTRKEKQHYRVAFRRSFEFVLRHMKGEQK